MDKERTWEKKDLPSEGEVRVAKYGGIALGLITILGMVAYSLYGRG